MKRGICTSLHVVAIHVVAILFMVAIFALVAEVAGKVYLQQQTIENLENQIASLEATSTWPMRFETRTRVPMIYSTQEDFLQSMYDRIVETEDFQYAFERDLHDNPLLKYMFLEAHSQIDKENDPIRYYAFDEVLAQQAITWDRLRSDEPYLGYHVIYPGGQD